MATYWVKSGQGGTDAGTSWANAAESIPGLMTAQAIAGGDVIYVHNTHAYNAGAAITVNAIDLFFPVDRFFGIGQATDGVFTLQRSTTAPTGFVNSVIATVTTADATVGATAIVVDSNAGFTTGYPVGIEVSPAVMQWTTVASVVGTTINLTDPLDADVTSGNVLFL